MKTDNNTKDRVVGPTRFPHLLLRRLYMFWAGSVWFITFVFLYPFFCLCIWFPFLQGSMVIWNQIWCRVFFGLSGIRVVTTGKEHLPRSGPAIYVANHGSFLDIAHLTYILPRFPAFMGKASLGRIPVFGYFFRNLHVVVERKSQLGRAKALKASRRKLAAGRGMVIFPEGSIHDSIQPHVSGFKDGAFRLAIENKVPLVPVTLCYNWYILPDDGRWLPNFYYCKAIVHPAVDTRHLDDSHVPALRDETWALIHDTLHRENQSLKQRIRK